MAENCHSCRQPQLSTLPPQTKLSSPSVLWWLSIFLLNIPIGRELIKLCGSFYSSSKTMKCIHNIRIIELIYIRRNMSIGTGTVFCFIVGQMTLLELCRFRYLSGLMNEEKLCKFVRRYVQSALMVILSLLRTARVSTCVMHRISAFMWRIFLGGNMDFKNERAIQSGRVEKAIMSRGVKMRKGVLILQKYYKIGHLLCLLLK